MAESEENKLGQKFQNIIQTEDESSGYLRKSGKRRFFILGKIKTPSQSLLLVEGRGQSANLIARVSFDSYESDKPCTPQHPQPDRL
jgi:hypothetical protein